MRRLNFDEYVEYEVSIHVYILEVAPKFKKKLNEDLVKILLEEKNPSC
jgi:hypothetical protein